MSSLPLEPALIVAGIGIGATLIGIIYRQLRGRVQENEGDISKLDERVDTLESKVSTLFAWAFGNHEDPADRGMSQDVDDGFNELYKRLDELEDGEKERHDQVMDRFRQLVDALHDEDTLEFDRRDIE